MQSSRWSSCILHDATLLFCACRPYGRLALLVLLLWLCSACAARTARAPEAEETVPLSEVKRITFTGNEEFSARTLRKVLATQPRPLWPPWKRGEAYNAPTIEEDLLRVKKFYFDQGFLDTQVSLANTPEELAQEHMELRIAIDEGEPTMVAAVRLEGTRPAELPAMPELLKALPLRPQKRLTKADFDTSREGLLTRLNNAGYARAQVVPQTAVDPQAHTAEITFTLQPGELAVFGPTTITGEQQVKEQAIRRQLDFEEGQRYSKEALDNSADAIYGLGMFQAVTPTIRNLDEAGTPLEVDFAIRERKPRSLELGAGYSTVERLRVNARWIHRNLFHGAEQLTLVAKVTSIEQGFDARLFFPYALARRTSFTQTLFVRNEQEIAFGKFLDDVFNVEEAQPAFDLFTYGGESRLDHRFTRTLSGGGGISLSSNNFSNVDTEALSDMEEELAQDNFLFVQFAEVLWRTSDSLLNPTKGFLLRGRLDHSSTAVLSDVSFIKLVFEARHYQRLWDHVILATRLEIGGIQPYGDSTSVPFNVRFFAGGPGSVRGFALNRLGPLNSEGDPIGGESLIEGSVEVRFPIFGNFGGVVFLDFGNVFLDPFTYPLDELRYAVGPGIRYNTPIGPVRVDLGIIIDPREDEDFGRVEFSIGQAF